MSQPNSNFDREAFVFMKREEQDHARSFLTEEEYFTAAVKAETPGLRDAVMLNFGNWLVKMGNDLKTRSLHTKLSEKQI